MSELPDLMDQAPTSRDDPDPRGIARRTLKKAHLQRWPDEIARLTASLDRS